MCKSVSYVLGWIMFALMIDTATASLVRPVPTDLESTLDLYLSSDDFYEAGDLITESQLREFQSYLRRTRGSSLATHEKWAKRVLGDRDPLANLFHNGGAEVIRAVAAKTGEYSALDRLTRTPRGRAVVQKAIKEKTPELVLEAIKAQEKQQAEANKKKKSKAVPQPKNHRIYTAQDFVTAVNRADLAANQPKKEAGVEIEAAKYTEKPASER